MKKIKFLFGIGSSLLFVILFFQNCGQMKSAIEGNLSSNSSNASIGDQCDNFDCSALIANQNTSCFLNGEVIEDGNSVAAYLTPEADSCQMESRTCQAGQLSGTFQFNQCIENQLIENNQRPCIFNNQQIPHGGRVMAYLNGQSNASGECPSEERVCNNGSLSGAYQFGSCDQTPTCLFNGRTYQQDQYVEAFRLNSEGICEREFRLCKDGAMTGSFPMANCSNQNQSCLFSTLTILHGDSRRAFGTYDTRTNSCAEETRTCNNGQLSGGLNNLSCIRPQPKRNCKFNGETILSGGIITAYKKEENSQGIRCLQTQRTCDDGTLDGDNTYALPTCEETTYASCIALLRGASRTTVAHGAAIKTFEYESAGELNSCDSFSAVSRCNNGNFDIEPKEFASCEPLPPPPGRSCELQATENGVAVTKRTLADGQTDSLFKSRSVDVNQVPGGCRDASQILQISCQDGQLINTAGTPLANPVLDLHPEFFCTTTGNSCNINGQAVNHSAYFSVYQSDLVNYSATISSCSDNNNQLSGYCINGQIFDNRKENPLDISGYTENTCTLNARTCTRDGETFEHGRFLTTTYYKNQTVPFVEMTIDGRDRSCGLNGNMDTPMCIDGRWTQRVYNSTTMKFDYPDFDFAGFQHTQCTAQGQACNAYGTSYPHGTQLGARYKQNILPYIDATTSCSARTNRVDLICKDGALTEINANRAFRGTFIPRENVDPMEFQHRTCAIQGSDCVIGTTTYRHNQAVGDRNRTTTNRDYGRLYRTTQRPYSFTQDTCMTNNNGVYAKCINGTVTSPDGPIDLSIYTQSTCTETGTTCTHDGRTFQHNQYLQLYRSNQIVVTGFSTTNCATNGNRITTRCLDGKLYENDRLYGANRALVEVDLTDYRYATCELIRQ